MSAPDRPVLLVTGADGGIGSAVARLAARRNYAVAAHYWINRPGAEALVQQIAAEGGRAAVVHADVRVESEVVLLFETVESELGPIAALVACAGITGERTPLESLTLANLENVLDTNLVGSFLCAREAVRRMRRHGRGGGIVMVSSTAAQSGGGGGGIIAYAASKAGIEALTAGLAREVGPSGIRVNAVRPGAIDTPMNAFDKNPEHLAYFSQTSPLRRIGRPEEVAASILWLLSEEASFVHGAVLTVSGGR
jgi:NAD(P)-dependent dehydrogenase (short-subunit alcohol dehydrogenase family)